MVNIINQQKKDPRPVIRFSILKNYFSCPYSYKLAQTETPRIAQSTLKVMAKGNLFEFFVTKMTSDTRDLDAVIKKNKGGFDGMTKKTVDKIRADAKYVEQYILEMDECQTTLEVENDRFKFVGTLDFIGVLKFDDWEGPMLCISDLKYTSEMDIWNNKLSKEDFMQAIIYVWLLYRNTGKILPFVYVVTQSLNEDSTITKPFIIHVTLEDIKAFQQNELMKVLNDKEFKPNPSQHNCLGTKGVKSKCWYLDYCTVGKQLLQNSAQYKYGELE